MGAAGMNATVLFDCFFSGRTSRERGEGKGEWPDESCGFGVPARGDDDYEHAGTAST